MARLWHMTGHELGLDDENDGIRNASGYDVVNSASISNDASFMWGAADASGPYWIRASDYDLLFAELSQAVHDPSELLERHNNPDPTGSA